MKKFNLSKAADIQPETLLKNKLFHHRYFAKFLSETFFSGSFRTKHPNQPSVIMQPGILLKLFSLTRPFSVTTLLLWKLKARCWLKWLWVKSHFTSWLSRYAWRSNTSLIYNLGQKVGDKFTKLSKIGFSMEFFTTDILQFFNEKRQNLTFGLTAGYSPLNPITSGIFLKLPNFLRS